MKRDESDQEQSGFKLKRIAIMSEPMVMHDLVIKALLRLDLSWEGEGEASSALCPGEEMSSAVWVLCRQPLHLT